MMKYNTPGPHWTWTVSMPNSLQFRHVKEAQILSHSGKVPGKIIIDLINH